MNKFVIPAAGLVLLLASGILFGIQTGRTRDPERLAAAADRLGKAASTQVDGWTAEHMEIPADQLRVAEASGGASVRFTRVTPAAGNVSSTVDMMLLCGPHGPIALHPPTVCFTGAGYRQCADVRRVQVDDAAGKPLGVFWMTEFERIVDGVPRRTRTWWAWSDDGTWSAPESARMTFAGVPVLYKLYLTEVVPPTDEAPADGEPTDDGAITASAGSIRDLAEILLPKLRTSLFAGTDARQVPASL